MTKPPLLTAPRAGCEGRNSLSSHSCRSACLRTVSMGDVSLGDRLSRGRPRRGVTVGTTHVLKPGFH